MKHLLYYYKILKFAQKIYSYISDAMTFSRRRVTKLFVSLVGKFILDSVVLQSLLVLVIGLIADDCVEQISTLSCCENTDQSSNSSLVHFLEQSFIHFEFWTVASVGGTQYTHQGFFLRSLINKKASRLVKCRKWSHLLGVHDHNVQYPCFTSETA
jgi:hypothetical protein